MRRKRPARPEGALAELAKLMQAGEGLRYLIAQLPAGATIEDARRLHERIRQQGRHPSPLLDHMLGIDRA